MTIKVVIPASLQRFTDGKDELIFDPKNVVELIELIATKYPEFKEKLCTQNNQINNYFNLYVDGEDIRFLDNLNTSLVNKKELIIVAAVAGGFAI